MLLQYNRDKDHDPIAHECEKVLEDDEKMVATCNGADEVDEGNHTDPKIAWDHFTVATQDLTAKCCRVCAWNIVCYNTECNNDAAKLAEGSNGAIRFENKGARGDVIGS